MPTSESIANAVGSVVDLTVKERHAVLEIAYCTVVSDQAINDSERNALRLIAKKLASQGEQEHSIDDDIADLLGRMEVSADRELRVRRLRKIATQLTTASARAIAYKAAFALAQADNEASDGEFEFDLELIDALDLPQDEADRLAAEVTRALAT